MRPLHRDDVVVRQPHLPGGSALHSRCPRRMIHSVEEPGPAHRGHRGGRHPRRRTGGSCSTTCSCSRTRRSRTAWCRREKMDAARRPHDAAARPRARRRSAPRGTRVMPVFEGDARQHCRRREHEGPVLSSSASTTWWCWRDALYPAIFLKPDEEAARTRLRLFKRLEEAPGPGPATRTTRSSASSRSRTSSKRSSASSKTSRTCRSRRGSLHPTASLPAPAAAEVKPRG